MIATPTMSALGDFILRRIAELNLSQRAAAERFGVSRSTLNDIIRGSTKSQDLPTLETIAKALGVPLAQLLELAGFTLDDRRDAERERQERQLRYLTPQDKEFLLDEMSPDELRDLIDYARKQRRRRLSSE
jgi:transcriptional regulator with XRE-family HTH domain